jgi:hypothetical protein
MDNLVVSMQVKCWRQRWCGECNNEGGGSYSPHQQDDFPLFGMDE